MDNHNQAVGHKTEVAGLREGVHRVMARRLVFHTLARHIVGRTVVAGHKGWAHRELVFRRPVRHSLAWERFARACWDLARAWVPWGHSLVGHKRVHHNRVSARFARACWGPGRAWTPWGQHSARRKLVLGYIGVRILAGGHIPVVVSPSGKRLEVLYPGHLRAAHWGRGPEVGEPSLLLR